MTRRDFWRTLILTSAVCLLPLAAGLLLWGMLPESVPVHWNTAGEPDGYASRAFAVFVLPVIFLAINLFTHACVQLDPNAQKASRVILAIAHWTSPVMALLCMGIAYAWALGTELAVERIVPAGVGVLIAFIGNYLPKCRPNRTIGIRVPWTLASDENWMRTHRFGGWLYLATGILVAVGGLCGFVAILFVALPLFFVPVVYSYVLHRQGI